MSGALTWLLVLGATAGAPAPPAPAVPEAMTCFVRAYPKTVCGAAPDALTLCDGARIPWDDGRDKSDFETLLNAPDLQDTMTMRYRRGSDYPVPPLNFEPGRIRHLPFFEAMYGASKAAVKAQLVPVRWLLDDGGKTVLMTRVNGVAAALQRVSDDIARELSPELRELAAKCSGTFNWRTIRGAKRRSLHSFGVAIDIGVARSNYWDWTKPDAQGRYTYRNRFPLEIVEIFERHGFIWGGKWYHFDTMHFEYRPELLTAPCVDAP
ncbi:MAG: M15 family peptidase [Deltaproteobacteria bacterium]|nr:MAG: M15 family peptidase [Deltaproteobacteria bacterium]